MKFSIDLFDSRGNKNTGWSQGETRGERPYILGWSGHGLNVLQKYENDDWLWNTGSTGELCMEYHGTIINFSESILK